jgi:hypothetical protein
MKEFRANATRTVEKASKDSGPLYLKRHGIVVAIIVTPSWAWGITDSLVEKGEDFIRGKTYAFGSLKLRKDGSSLSLDLLSGEKSIIWVTKYYEDTGALVSPTLLDELLIACPMLKKYDWSEIKKAS